MDTTDLGRLAPMESVQLGAGTNALKHGVGGDVVLVKRTEGLDTIGHQRCRRTLYRCNKWCLGKLGVAGEGTDMPMKRG